MRPALAGLILAMVMVPAAAEETAYVANLSCSQGPYRAKLPATYKGLRSMAKVKRERTLSTTDNGAYKSYVRELRFVGLEVVVVAFSNSDRYQLSKMTIT